MELSDFNTADSHGEGSEMQVRKPDGELTDCYIKLVGIDSPLWRDIVRERQRLSLSASLSGESNDASETDISKATIGWRGFTDNGDEVEFSTEKAKQLYLAAPYILDQADVFIANRANFT